MKIVIFSVVGLALGTLGGTAFGGLKGKAVLLAEMEAEKAAEVAHQEEAPEAQDTHGSLDESASEPGGEDHPSEDPATPSTDDPAPSPIPEEDAEATVEETEAHQASVPETQEQDPQELPSGQPALPVEGTDPPPVENGGSARLAKIFGSMKAPDAARVLQNLDDEEIQAVLAHLTNRKAAEILGNFEPARAATLSRLVLVSSGGEGS